MSLLLKFCDSKAVSFDVHSKSTCIPGHARSQVLRSNPSRSFPILLILAVGGPLHMSGKNQWLLLLNWELFVPGIRCPVSALLVGSKLIDTLCFACHALIAITSVPKINLCECQVPIFAQIARPLYATRFIIVMRAFVFKRWRFGPNHLLLVFQFVESFWFVFEH